MTEETQAPPPIEVSPEEASSNFYWTLGQHEVFNIQTTIRGNPTPDEIAEHLRSAGGAMRAIVTLGGHAKPVGRQAENAAFIPAPITPMQAALDTGKAVAGPPVPSAPVASSNGQGESKCTMIEIGKGFKSGKTQLKFHCVGLENPLTFTKEVGEMVKLLAPLGYTTQHISIGQKYPADAIVSWAQGEKYKNIISVRPNA